LVSNSISDDLEQLGFTPREAKLYLALVGGGEFTAADLHRLAGIPRTKIYETLDSMVRRGFCTERVEGRSRFFRAADQSGSGGSPRGWESELSEKLSRAARFPANFNFGSRQD
jgi:hypothetical protein